MTIILRTTLTAVALAVALSGCATSASSQPAATPVTTAVSQAQATVANAAPSEGPCGDTQFVIDLVTGLQQGHFPDDSRSAAHEFGALVNTAPAEIKTATDHLIGPVVSTLQHPGMTGGVSTDATKADLQLIEDWHAAHC